MCVPVYDGRKSRLGSRMNSNSEVGAEMCVTVLVLIRANTTQRERIMEIHTLALANKSPTHMVPFYLCRISSMCLTVTDTLINMSVALILNISSINQQLALAALECG